MINICEITNIIAYLKLSKLERGIYFEKYTIHKLQR